MKTLITTVILFGFCAYVTYFSNDHLALIAIGAISVIGVVATLLTSIWMEGPFLRKLIKAAKIAFPFSALIFLLGYFYVILRVVIWSI